MSPETIDLIMDLLSWLNVIVLTIGIIFSFKYYRPGLIYFIALVFLENMSVFIPENNLFLFSTSYFLHFSCLGYYILVELLGWRKKNYVLLILIASLFMLYNLKTQNSVESYQSYDRLFYNFAILLFSMAAIAQFIRQKIKVSAANIIFFLITLSYFSLDLVMALATNYLVNQPVTIVLGVWLFRAIILSLFYISLINLVWKHSIK